MKKTELREMIREEMQALNEGSLTKDFEKALEELITKIEKGEGVDKRYRSQHSTGELLGMFLTPVMQNVLLRIKDRKGFSKNFHI